MFWTCKLVTMCRAQRSRIIFSGTKFFSPSSKRNRPASLPPPSRLSRLDVLPDNPQYIVVYSFHFCCVHTSSPPPLLSLLFIPYWTVSQHQFRTWCIVAHAFTLTYRPPLHPPPPPRTYPSLSPPSTLPRIPPPSFNPCLIPDSAVLPNTCTPSPLSHSPQALSPPPSAPTASFALNRHPHTQHSPLTPSASTICISLASHLSPRLIAVPFNRLCFCSQFYGCCVITAHLIA